mgnify:CR=1 FL=1
MKASEIREMSGEELLQNLEQREKDIVQFRLQQATAVVDNVRASREARKDIARIKTVMRERELAASKGTE